MISKTAFVKIVDALDELWNEKIEHLRALDMEESYIATFSDIITEAISEEIDPKHRARTDEAAMDCGDYVCEWLFGTGEFQEICKTAEDLYDYIINKYNESI